MLIALEGLDGSGTTTQTALLAEHLRARGLQVHETCEPSAGPIGELVRKVITGKLSASEEATALLFAADRLDHVTREIQPKLDAGMIVVTDRYLLSSLAYQATMMDLEWVAQINARAPRPDVSVLLRVKPETAAERRALRNASIDHFDTRQRQIYQLYEKVMERDDVGQCCAVDAEGDTQTVARAIAETLEPFLVSRG